MADKKAANGSPKYDREELIRQARELFGVAREALAGALHEDGRQELTIEEAKQTVKQFLNRKVN